MHTAQINSRKYNWSDNLQIFTIRDKKNGSLNVTMSQLADIPLFVFMRALGIESDKEIARKQKRKLQYYSNILVVSDSSNPENEGKVMLYKYGKKIFDKVMEAMQPQFEDEEPINPFDPWEGANFKLKIRKVDGYWNYDKSEFDKSTKIGNDEKIESVISKLYALSEFLSDSNFKSYEELKKRLDTVLTGTQTASKPIAEVLDDEEEYKPSFSSSPSKMENVPFSQEDDEENAMSYFQKLANE